MRDTTRENIHKQMAIILFEKNKGEAISVATIQGEFGNQFQITGNFSSEETNRLAILIRSGSLAAPMDIIEERTIGPNLGAAQVEQGFKSTLWGFLAITAFMCVYYVFFGLISTLALGANVLLLVALLSLFQATLTLPGIAAIALALGMAIDSNVLINERIREELRNGATPQAAITAGYDRAFDTILDSNVTTFIVGVMLLAFGSGPIKGFAVVHCLGILTSMFQRRAGLAHDHQLRLRSTAASSTSLPSARSGVPKLNKRQERKHGTVPHSQRHPVHASCVGVQRNFADHFPAGRFLPVLQGTPPVSGIHRGYGNPADLHRSSPGGASARNAHQSRLCRRGGPDLRLLARHHGARPQSRQ